MLSAITNTSPLLYLHRASSLHWFDALFDSVWVPRAVLLELEQGCRRGYDVPDQSMLPWLEIVEPKHIPSTWFALDLGVGELAAMALALENPTRVVLLDDQLARRTAQAAGITVWGTLRVVLEVKDRGLIPKVAPVIKKLRANGMWISASVQHRILDLAGE